MTTSSAHFLKIVVRSAVDVIAGRLTNTENSASEFANGGSHSSYMLLKELKDVRRSYSNICEVIETLSVKTDETMKSYGCRLQAAIEAIALTDKPLFQSSKYDYPYRETIAAVDDVAEYIAAHPHSLIDDGYLVEQHETWEVRPDLHVRVVVTRRVSAFRWHLTRLIRWRFRRSSERPNLLKLLR